MWELCIPDGLSVVQCSLGHVIRTVFFFYTIWVAWSERACQLAAGGVASIWRSCVWSPPGSSILNQQISARAQFRINTLRCLNWQLCIPDGLSGIQCSIRHIIGIVFWHNLSGMKRTCWTTGSWRFCLNLEVVSSIPTGSTIIYRFLCGFICVSLCQSIKTKPTNVYPHGAAKAQLLDGFCVKTRPIIYSVKSR